MDATRTVNQPHIHKLNHKMTPTPIPHTQYTHTNATVDHNGRR